MIYATKLLLSKTGFFRDKNFLHLDALDDWTRQRLPAVSLRCACQQGKCIHEICDWRATRMLVDRDGILGRHRCARLIWRIIKDTRERPRRNILPSEYILSDTSKGRIIFSRSLLSEYGRIRRSQKGKPRSCSLNSNRVHFSECLSKLGQKPLFCLRSPIASPIGHLGVTAAYEFVKGVDSPRTTWLAFDAEIIILTLHAFAVIHQI